MSELATTYIRHAASHILGARGGRTRELREFFAGAKSRYKFGELLTYYVYRKIV